MYYTPKNGVQHVNARCIRILGVKYKMNLCGTIRTVSRIPTRRILWFIAGALQCNVRMDMIHATY